MQQKNTIEQELLYFWVFGDLHFRDNGSWRALHTPRMAQMFEDVHTIWRQEGKPAFCVAPGDIVDRGANIHYELAKRELATHLADIPLYPGIGNHEYQPDGKNDMLHTAEEFSAAWSRPVRYTWTAGPAQEIVCIMLDQPNPFLPGMREEHKEVIFSQEVLTFLDSMLTEHASRITIIFAHCPLQNTVLDRDPERNLDDDSQDPFFYVNNSDEVRTLLAQHSNAVLYVSGHTHSGWGSPQLVLTEQSRNHPVTHVNVMSPWYTGRGGPRMSQGRTHLEYRTDSPDVQATFAFRVFTDKIRIRARDHQSHQWLAEWEIPIR